MATGYVGGYMQVIVVGQEQEFTTSLVYQLTTADFKVTVLENSVAVLNFIKKSSLQFLIGDVSVIVGDHLGREVLKRCPLARLVGFSSESSRIGMIDSLVYGLVDYFPRQLEVIPQLVWMMDYEREKLRRWQKTLLLVATGFTKIEESE